jgi:hypothetical protein
MTLAYFFNFVMSWSMVWFWTLRMQKFHIWFFTIKAITNSPNQNRRRRMKIQIGMHFIYLANHNMKKKKIIYDTWHDMIWRTNLKSNGQWISFTVSMSHRISRTRQHSIFSFSVALGGANSVSRSDDSMLLCPTTSCPVVVLRRYF